MVCGQHAAVTGPPDNLMWQGGGRLIALADVPLTQQQGPITIFPIAQFLLGIVPGAPLPV